MKPYTHLIWDFNGTLFDDLAACIQSANALLERYALPQLGSVEEYRALFGFPIIDYYHRLGFDFEKIRYADLAVEWVAYYLEYTKDSKLFVEVPKILETVRSRGIRQLILSATEREMLLEQVRKLEILEYFDDVLGLSDYHAYSKEDLGRAWRKENPDANPLFVGDTDHDAAVARAMGADCILVGTGHQSMQTLRDANPLAAVGTLEDILQFL